MSIFVAALFIAAVAQDPASSPASDVAVDFVVTVPPTSQPAQRIFIAGNVAPLGFWRADGLALTRQDDGRYHATIRVPRGSSIEYKLTGGSWETVEKSAQGGDIGNRRLAPMEDMTVEIAVASWAGAAGPARKNTRTGDIRTHAGFDSRILDGDRTLIVYLPRGYEKNAPRRYPVLYMHDGQNLFDAATSFLGVEWEADETAERLIDAGRIEPIIIVGIYNTGERMNEYTPWPDERRHAGGRGERYAKFLVEEVKPFIDSTYRTQTDRKHTAVAGSSLGGLISLYICEKYPDTFSMCGVLSPALMWADKRIIRESADACGALKQCRIWLDMGSREGDSLGDFSQAIGWTRELVAVFDRCGLVPGRDYYYFEDVGAVHNEGAWAKRFDKLLLLFFAK